MDIIDGKSEISLFYYRENIAVINHLFSVLAVRSLCWLTTCWILRNMDLETKLYISVGALGAGWVVLAVVALILCCKVKSLNKKFQDLMQTNKLRVQKLKMDRDKNFAYQNPSLVPDEELTKRGYSMYMGSEDAEAGRGTERQTGGQLVAELTKEIDSRKQRSAPPFLLQAIEDNKRNSRNLNNPVAGGGSRASVTNPNFIY